MTEDSRYPKKVMIEEIAKFFTLEQVTGNHDSLNRWVVIPDVNRPGFELSGYFKPTEPRRVVILGNKELEYIGTLTDDQQRERYQSITDGFTPMIVVTHNDPIPPVLYEVAQQRNFPIFKTQLPTYRFMVDLITYLDEKLAQEETISGVLVQIYGRGVLITGESGLGKSEVALEVLRDGMKLIADDRVDVQKIHNNLFGHAPDMLYGMLEIRGIGIVDVERMFGPNSVAKSSKIDLVLNFVHYNPEIEYARIGDEVRRYTKILDVLVPTMELPISAGRSMSALVETAVTNFILKEEGYDSTEQFKERLECILEEKNKGNHEG